MSKTVRNYFILSITALVWGASFVAQREGVLAVGIYTFSFVRYLMASAVLLPVIRLMEKERTPFFESGIRRRDLLIGGTSCGIILCLATNLQQVGLHLGCSAGKAGFLTAFYIVMVPVFGLFLGRKNRLRIWISVALGLAGLYLLCIKDSFIPEAMDGFEIACACVFSVHILTIDHFSPRVNGVKMSCLQFLTAGILSSIPMVLCDMKDISAWSAGLASPSSWPPLLYGGIMASGVGYTLQIIGQKGVNPSVASLIMSMESVFSVLAGFLLLGERLSVREMAGCIVMFVAVIMASLPVKNVSVTEQVSADRSAV